jgi:hypothetical protein
LAKEVEIYMKRLVYNVVSLLRAVDSERDKGRTKENKAHIQACKKSHPANGGDVEVSGSLSETYRQIQLAVGDTSESSRNNGC